MDIQITVRLDEPSSIKLELENIERKRKADHARAPTGKA